MESLYEKLLSPAGETCREDVPRPRASAAVVPWRRSAGGGTEVFWVRRSPGVPFMPGWHAFPGGGLSRRDPGVDVAGRARGLDPGRFTAPLPGLGPEETQILGPDLVPGLLAATLRELFEETGLLLETPGAPARNPERLTDLRHRLVDRETDLGSLAAAEGWRLDASELVYAGRWLTPPLAPVRFDNRFFLLEWPRERAVQPRVLGRELDRGEWVDPEAALAAWRRAEVLAAPPILHLLRVLAEDGPEAGLGRLLDPVEADLGPMRRIEFRPGILLLPLRTATLLPATHTHAFLLGRDPAILVDPGPTDPAEVRVLLEVLAAFRRRGGRPTEIWLTHHHPDHVGAVEAVRRTLGLRVRAHPRTAEILSSRGLAVDGDLEDGALVRLGGGDPELRLRILHTPGHASGHLAFFEERSRSLLAGDLVSALSTIVIDPPDGDMDAYLESLERVAALEPTTVFPSHGPVLRGPDRLHSTRTHRLEREVQVLAAWRDGLRTPEEITPRVYSDVSPGLFPIAARQVLAHLERLRGRGALD